MTHLRPHLRERLDERFNGYWRVYERPDLGLITIKIYRRLIISSTIIALENCRIPGYVFVYQTAGEMERLFMDLGFIKKSLWIVKGANPND